MSGFSERRVSVWQNKISVNVKVAGSGPPLVFLHGAGGPIWDELLDRLALRYTVYAPEFPGTSEGDPEAISQLDNLWDVVLCYSDLLEALKLNRPALVGHSFGGMLAAELAANHPAAVSKLCLLCPIGLWKEEVPVVNWMMLTPATDLPKYLLYDPQGPLARERFGVPDPEMQIRMIWSMACTGKFVWPIPDKGLKKRIHRVQAPTLVLWGKQDRLVPAAYAEEFARRIPGAKLELIDEAGHLFAAEHPERVADLIETFLQDERQHATAVS